MPIGRLGAQAHASNYFILRERSDRRTLSAELEPFPGKILLDAMTEAEGVERAVRGVAVVRRPDPLHLGDQVAAAAVGIARGAEVVVLLEVDAFLAIPAGPDLAEVHPQIASVVLIDVEAFPRSCGWRRRRTSKPSSRSAGSKLPVEPLQPELLLYEPQKNGKLRFVGVEYIVPFADHPATEAPPTLLGQEYAQVPEFGVWGLRIWVGRENPSGIFASWNPKVSCEHAGLQGVTTGHSHRP
jgi:hypothetical protein